MQRFLDSDQMTYELVSFVASQGGSNPEMSSIVVEMNV